MNHYFRSLVLKFKSTLKGNYLKFRYAERVSPDDKVILINLPQNKFNRYLYPLVYMFYEQGYKSILKLNASGIAHLVQDPYQTYILTKGLLFTPCKENGPIKEVSLNPDYFNALRQKSLRKNIIPMSMHPQVYSKKLFISVNFNKFNRVILFAGTTVGFGHDKKQIFQGVISRYEVLKKVKTFKNSFFLKNNTQYENYTTTVDKTSFLIFERHFYNLSQPRLFEEMNRYSFFLALPGRGMPLCHNLIEAMYCNCIPVLQDIYAKMMPIPLEDGLNCLIYKDLRDIEKLSDRIERLSDTCILNLHKQVRCYFDSYLTSEAITKQVLRADSKVLYLQAEGFSINLYEGE